MKISTNTCDELSNCGLPAFQSVFQSTILMPGNAKMQHRHGTQVRKRSTSRGGIGTGPVAGHNDPALSVTSDDAISQATCLNGGSGRTDCRGGVTDLHDDQKLLQRAKKLLPKYRNCIVCVVACVLSFFAIQFVSGYFLTSQYYSLPIKEDGTASHNWDNAPLPIPPSSDSGELMDPDSLDEEFRCDLKLHKDARSALNRAKTAKCKRAIAEVACGNEKQTLYPHRLPNLCPVQVDEKVLGNYMGCYQDSFSTRLLSGIMSKQKSDNSRETCLKLCTESGFLYAGVQYAVECFCGNERPDLKKRLEEADCNRECPGNPEQKCGGYLTMNIYQTGLIPFKTKKPAASAEDDAEQPVRVVFLLTLSGRAVRQVKRLLKAIYHAEHYFLIHVDSRQDLMYRELLQLEETLPVKNVRLVRKRMATIWGGASLLQMLIHCMAELLKLSHWHWDYVLNLSESDYPVKSTEQLVSFLSSNRGSNFVKSHGRSESHTFIKKQGLDRTFVECENHMWRVGTRHLPVGVQVDGGSDWICLHKDFVHYVVESKDDMLEGLRKVYKYSLLPGESFFHMALRNSPFCSTTVNNNLHLTNWRRKQGCKCQHRVVVDWCGCSPNDFLVSDGEKLNHTSERDVFFARKFEPIVDQTILDKVDQWLLSRKIPRDDGSDSYWENIYHHLDESPQPRKELISQAKVLIILHMLQQNDNDGELRRLPSSEDIKLLQAHSFKLKDKFHGILIHFSAEGGPVQELLVQPKSNLQRAKMSRKVEVSVGTDFDPKELIFRNLANVIGPLSTPFLKYSVSEEEDENESKSQDEEGVKAKSYLTFAWYDPSGDCLSIQTKSFNASTAYVDAVKSDLANPLRPGIWHVLVIDGDSGVGDVVARLAFLVAPIVYADLDDEARLKLHAGSAGDLSLSDEKRQLYQAHFDKNLLEDGITQGLAEQSDLNSKKLGKDLLEWTLELTSHFYEVPGDRAEHVCNVSPAATDSFLARGVLASPTLHSTHHQCKTVAWSSFSPDRKSYISTVDETSGLLL